MGKKRVLSLVLLTGLFCLPAVAQERVCEGFGLSDYRKLLDIGQEAVSKGHFPKAFRILSDTQTEMRCLDRMLHPDDIVRLAELFALVSLMDQDEEQARRWAQLRFSVTGRAEWPSDLPAAFTTFFENTPDPTVQTLDPVLLHPKKQAVTMNGTLLESLRAPIEVPVFVQLVSRAGDAELSYWQDGARFRDDLSRGKGKARAPAWSVGLQPTPPKRTGLSQPVKVGRDAEDGGHQKGWISQADPSEWMPDCKWVGQSVVAKKVGDNGLQINDLHYELTHISGETDLMSDLKMCHEYVALRRFEKWRAAAKRAARAAPVTDIDWQSLGRALKTAADEVSADIYRDQFLRALNRDR